MYQLCDANGYKADFVTGRGLDDLKRAVERSKVKTKHLEHFLILGWSTKMSDMVRELKKMRTKDPAVRETIDFLIETLPSCELVVIIWDGTT